MITLRTQAEVDAWNQAANAVTSSLCRTWVIRDPADATRAALLAVTIADVITVELQGRIDMRKNWKP